MCPKSPEGTSHNYVYKYTHGILISLPVSCTVQTTLSQKKLKNYYYAVSRGNGLLD